MLGLMPIFIRIKSKISSLIKAKFVFPDQESADLHLHNCDGGLYLSIISLKKIV